MFLPVTIQMSYLERLYDNYDTPISFRVYLLYSTVCGVSFEVWRKSWREINNFLFELLFGWYRVVVWLVER